MEWIWIPIAIAIVIVVSLVILIQTRISSRLQIGWHRPLHDTRIQEEGASQLELAVIAWIRSYRAADFSFPTYEVIMEHSRRIDPDGVGVDLSTAMACYRTVRDGNADQLELAVVTWIRSFYASHNSFPTYEVIMERSTKIDPESVGIDLSTAMACYKTAKDSLENASEEDFKE